MKEKIIAYNSMSLGTILGIIFIILKLCKVINWSWWWVTAPFWIEACIGLLVLVLIGIIMLVIKIKERN